MDSTLFTLPASITKNGTYGGYSLLQNKAKVQYGMTMKVTNDNGLDEVLKLIGPRFMHAESTTGIEEFPDFNGWNMLAGVIDPILFHRPYCVVEVGCGKSTEILMPAAIKAGVPYFAVDMNIKKKEHFETIISQWGEQSECGFFLMDVNDFMETFREPCAVVLIDDYHMYEHAKKEFDFFWELLVAGGVIFLHDTFPPHEFMIRDTACGDVYKLRRELEKRTFEMDVFTWPYTAGYNGLTMVIKKDPQRPYWGR